MSPDSPQKNHLGAAGELVSVAAGAHGLDLSVYDETFLAKSLAKRAAALSMDAPAWLAHLARDRAEAEAFLQSLNICHSAFFREPLTMALLEEMVLPALAREKEMSATSEVRVWSAGCAAGQEPWSVAILLEELSAGRERPVPYRMIATDIQESCLTAARRGVYEPEMLQNVRLGHLNAHFTREGGSYAVVSRLRDRVDFSVYDLLDTHTAGPPSGIFGDFDLVLCRNLLFYYSPDTQRMILDKVRRCLRPGGYLATGEAERAIVERAGGFRAVAPPAALFQKVMRKGR